MQQTARCSKRPLGIYLHIPFCIRKCLYCDFLSAPGDEQTKIEYVEALLHEIRAQAPLYDGHEVKTVFFGGGTPSLLSGEQIRRIMDCLHTVFSFSAEEGGAEVTMEANPGTLTPEKLADYRRAGINRLSIGLQSDLMRNSKPWGVSIPGRIFCAAMSWQGKKVLPISILIS